MSEEVSGLQEELDAARVELESLRAMMADREARASHLEAEVSELRGQLEEARGESASLGERAQTLESQVAESARRYRALVLERSPELPEELVAGETVEDIDQAVERARETVAKVRGHLESEAQSGRVPVGAPPRSAPDLSALSAEEKIQQGLDQRAAG